MRFVLHHSNFHATDDLDHWIENAIRSLHPFIRIEQANVVLAYDHRASPAYRASAHLVIPGPDVRAEAVDHTPRTAAAKLLAELRARAAFVASRRSRRHRRRHPARGFAQSGRGLHHGAMPRR